MTCAPDPAAARGAGVRHRAAVALLAAAATAAGCGGSDDDPVAAAPAPATAAPTAAQSAFTKSASWAVTLPAAGQSLCYDFDAAAEVAGCEGTQWDVKLSSGGRSATLYTNSGPNGTGRGGAFGGPFDHTWAELQSWPNATTSPTSGTIPATLYFADTAKSAFAGTNDIGSAAFEYDLNNDNRLYPTYRVFLVTTDNSNADATGASVPVYAVQVVGYYGGASGTTSGFVSLQWIDRANPATVQRATVDARGGWAYLDLASGAVTSEAGTWQIAFNRYNVKTNGGSSGSGTVGGFIGATPAGFYGADGRPLATAFAAATPESQQGSLTGTLAAPSAASDWLKDSVSSALAPAYRGTFPAALDYGWYRYFPTTDAAAAAGLPAVANVLQAQPTRAALVRSGEGTSYARMRLGEIRYADPQSATSAQTWTFEFGVQPAP